MKKTILGVFIILSVSIIFSCKKKSDCGCDSKNIDRELSKTYGELYYDQSNGKWALVYSFERAFQFYYPCNTDQDSLRAILQGASQNQTFLVTFSGNVKSPCSDEKFVSSLPYSKFNYIVLDSLRRY